MADKYYIREQSLDKKTVQIVIHIDIPAAGNNDAGIQWQAALLSYLGGASNISSVIPELQGTQEETDMQAGAIFEIVKPMRFSRLGLTNQQKLFEIDAWYQLQRNDVLIDLQIKLQYIGFTS